MWKVGYRESGTSDPYEYTDLNNAGARRRNFTGLDGTKIYDFEIQGISALKYSGIAEARGIRAGPT